MLSMCPNEKHSYKNLFPVHPESVASSAFKGKKIYDRRVKSLALKTYDTPHNSTYMRQIDSSPTGDVSQCAMQRPLYPCTCGTLVNKWSVIQQPSASDPPMPPVMTLLLFWNANPVMPYMYPGGVTYQPHYCWPVGVPHQTPGTKHFVASFSCLRTLFFFWKKKERKKKKKEKKKVTCISSIQYLNTSVAYRQSSSNWWTLSADRF